MLVLMPDLKVTGMVRQVAICQKETRQEVTTAGDQDDSQNDQHRRISCRGKSKKKKRLVQQVELLPHSFKVL